MSQTPSIREAARLVRSKNAGPFWLTIDIMFDNQEAYMRCKKGGTITKQSMAAMYLIPEDSLIFVHHDDAQAIKVSFPRLHSSGSWEDTDVFGGQQYAQLLDLPIE